MSCEAHGTQMDSKGNKYDGFGKKEVSDSPIWWTYLLAKDSYCKSSRYVEICSYMYCIQQDFCPVLFSPFSIANSFAPSWIRRNKVVFKRDYVRHWNSSSLKFACWQRGGKWQNKTGRILPYIQYALIVTDYLIVLCPSYPVQNKANVVVSISLLLLVIWYEYSVKKIFFFMCIHTFI